MTRMQFAAGSLATGVMMLAPSWALAQPERGWGMHGYGPGMMWGPGFGMIGFLLLIAAIAFGIYWALRGSEGKGGGQTSALGILNERFARGEIDEEEYQARKKVLEG